VPHYTCSYLAYSVFAAFINTSAAKTSMGYGLGAQFHDLTATILAGVIMASAIMMARRMIVLPPYAELAAMAILGAVVYTGTALVCRATILSDATSIFRNVRRPRSPMAEQ
jgi:hypothetical protein